MKSKLTIVFYSSTGTNLQMVKWAEDEAKKQGAEVRLRRVGELVPLEIIESNEPMKKTYEKMLDIPEVTIDDLDWADTLLFSSPTRFGAMASQMKQFLDTTGGFWAEGKTVNKVVSAMSSSQNPNGGQENTILNMYAVMHHWGAIVVAPGYSDESVFKAGGNPYGTSATVDQNGEIVEDVEPAVRHQVRRLLEVSDKML